MILLCKQEEQKTLYFQGWFRYARNASQSRRVASIRNNRNGTNICTDREHAFRIQNNIIVHTEITSLSHSIQRWRPSFNLGFLNDYCDLCAALPSSSASASQQQHHTAWLYAMGPIFSPLHRSTWNTIASAKRCQEFARMRFVLHCLPVATKDVWWKKQRISINIVFSRVPRIVNICSSVYMYIPRRLCARGRWTHAYLYSTSKCSLFSDSSVSSCRYALILDRTNRSSKKGRVAVFRAGKTSPYSKQSKWHAILWPNRVSDIF